MTRQMCVVFGAGCFAGLTLGLAGAGCGGASPGRIDVQAASAADAPTAEPPPTESPAPAAADAPAAGAPAAAEAAAEAPAAEPAAPGEAAPAEKEEFRPRLPAYYSQVVDDAQREQIYAIQRRCEPELARLREELKRAVRARDEEIEAVLSEEQRAKVKRLAEEAKARREAAGSPIAPTDGDGEAAP